MKRLTYFNYIDEKLSVLAYRIEQRGKLNFLELHNHSENFWLHLLNIFFSWSFDDANKLKQNVEAIDLIDHINKIVGQVSATCTKQKVEASLGKDIIKNHPGYTFKFISISKDATDLRSKSFNNPHGIAFNPTTDIIDMKSILNEFKGLTAAEQKPLYEFIKNELGNEVDIVRFDSNLAIIINIISKVNFKPNTKITINSFEIDRKITHNNLTNSKSIIDDCKPYSSKVGKKYAEFDKQGANKSISVLSAITSCLTEASIENTGLSNDVLFLNVIDKVINIVINSANYVEMPIDELELCVKVLVVDAFVRCKIFENPENYQYATA
jgi:hypothetical protein